MLWGWGDTGLWALAACAQTLVGGATLEVQGSGEQPP